MKQIRIIQKAIAGVSLAVFVFALLTKIAFGQVETIDVTRVTPVPVPTAPSVPTVPVPPTPPIKPEPPSPPGRQTPTPTPTELGETSTPAPSPTPTPTPTPEPEGDGRGGDGDRTSPSGGGGGVTTSPQILGLAATSGGELLDDLFLKLDVWGFNPTWAYSLTGNLPQKISIPTAGIDIGVAPAEVIDGQWEVFVDRAGFGLGSALPGAGGNTIIFAHRREGMFLNLRQVKPGTEIKVSAAGREFFYKVEAIKEVDPSDIADVGRTSDERLTLFTCAGKADSKRLIVIAKRALLSADRLLPAD